MTDFFDWLTAADSGLGTDRLRERFRLSEAEMRRATEALAPAFLLGLQRLAADPAAWADFMRFLSIWNTGAAAPVGTDASRDMLNRLFGMGPGPDSIARQASLMAGIAPGTIASMMPELAMMTLRTMMRMAGTPGAMPTARAMPGDAGGLAMAEMMRRSANALEAFSKPSEPERGAGAPPHYAYLERLFSDALRGGFPWMSVPAEGPSAKPSGRPTKAPAAETASAAASPFFAFAPLLEAFAGATPKREEQNKGVSRAASEPAGGDTSLTDPIASMTRAMEAGRTLQETYAQEMLAFFDRHRQGN